MTSPAHLQQLITAVERHDLAAVKAALSAHRYWPSQLNTALDVAAVNRHPAVAEQILGCPDAQHGDDAPLDATGALLGAIRAGDEAMVQALLPHCRHLGTQGGTLLTRALDEGHEALFETLFAAGARPTGPGPLRTALEQSRWALAERLVPLTPDLPTFLDAVAMAADGGPATLVAALLAAGAPLRADGQALRWAADKVPSANRTAVLACLVAQASTTVLDAALEPMLRSGWEEYAQARQALALAVPEEVFDRWVATHGPAPFGPALAERRLQAMHAQRSPTETKRRYRA